MEAAPAAVADVPGLLCCMNSSNTTASRLGAAYSARAFSSRSTIGWRQSYHDAEAGGTAAGTGGNPELGSHAANESIADITNLVNGADMVRRP